MPAYKPFLLLLFLVVAVTFNLTLVEGVTLTQRPLGREKINAKSWLHTHRIVSKRDKGRGDALPPSSLHERETARRETGHPVPFLPAFYTPAPGCWASPGGGTEWSWLRVLVLGR